MDTSKLKAINDDKAAQQVALGRHEDLVASTSKVSDTILLSTESLIKYLEGHTTKTEVVNQLEEIHTPDVKYVVEALQLLDQTLKTHENTDLTEITKVMQGILDEAKLIPKKLPDTPEKDIDYTDQFKNLTEAIKAVERVVEAQELVAEAPVVNVKEPKVNVEAPDLKPLQGSIKDVVKAVNKIVIPEYKTDNKEVEKLIKASNKLLKGILDKPVGGGGGGGGQSWVSVNASGIPVPIQLTVDGKIPVEATDNAVLDQIELNTDYGTVVGGGTETGALRVTVANNSTGVLSVDDNGSTLSVDDGSGSLTVDAPVGTPAFVRLSDGASAISTLPVSLASVPSHAVTNAGTFAVQNVEVQGTAGTLTNVTMTGASVTLQASNASRKNLMIFNDSGVVVYVKLGSSASATSFTIKMVDQSYYELPTPVYTGIVTALGASGAVRVTEVA